MGGYELSPKVQSRVYRGADPGRERPPSITCPVQPPQGEEGPSAVHSSTLKACLGEAERLQPQCSSRLRNPFLLPLRTLSLSVALGTMKVPEAPESQPTSVASTARLLLSLPPPCFSPDCLTTSRRRGRPHTLGLSGFANFMMPGLGICQT